MSEADFCGMDAGEYYATKDFFERERFYAKKERKQEMKNRTIVRHGNEAALIGGLISTYFFQPAVSASLKDAYRRVLEHLHQNALTSSDLQQIRRAVNFLMPMCQSNRQTQRELMGVNARTTALLNGSR